MTAVLAATLALWGYCGAMSVLVRREPPALQNPLVQTGSVVVYVALVGGCAAAFVRAGHPLVTMTGMALVLIIGVLLGFRYWSFLLGEWVGRLHAGATGIGTMKVRHTYDRAEKAEHDGRLVEAVALYDEAAAKDARDPEPLRRAGEVLLRRGDVEAALGRFRAALPLMETIEDRATLNFRMADVLAGQGRTSDARSLLEGVAREHAGTRFEGYAQERLRTLSGNQ